MKFTRNNNPKKRRSGIIRKSPYSRACIEDMRKQMYAELAKADTQEQRDAITKAYDVTIHPCR